jgi:hypothetical protein
MDVVFNGRQIDLSKVLPLRIRDWKTLASRYGITTRALATADIAEVSVLVWYVLNRADPTITQEEVDDIPAPPIPDVFTHVLNLVNAQQDVDVPFSTPSTSSAEPTAGHTET